MKRFHLTAGLIALSLLGLFLAGCPGKDKMMNAGALPAPAAVQQIVH